MRGLGIGAVVLLVVAFVFAVPAFASPPDLVDSTLAANLLTGEGSFTGTFEGGGEHVYSEGRADRLIFTGEVAGRKGGFEMLLVLQQGLIAETPGHEGKWVILDGWGELENLRGQGSFVVEPGFPIITLAFDGRYHFDPD